MAKDQMQEIRHYISVTASMSGGQQYISNLPSKGGTTMTQSTFWAEYFVRISD